MINENKVVLNYKSGKSVIEIAKELHVNSASVRDIIKSKNLPQLWLIKKLYNNKEFEEFFITLYNSTNDVKLICNELLKHSFFKNVKPISIHQRLCEIRNYYNLSPKSEQIQYQNQYDRIRGYMIRNSKFSAKRQGHEFNLKYTDFELPEYCPILGIKLEYGSGEGNNPGHASLDRIDNSKGYIPGNVMVISRLANQMKNCASFEQLENFTTNYKKLLDYKKEHGTLGNITDIFPHWKKLSLDS